MPEPEALLNPVSDEEGPLINDNVIRIQLRKPRHRKWELVTRNCSPGRGSFPTIQLFDCEGNLLLETNDDNISIKSSDVDPLQRGRRCSKSLGATDFAKRQINFPLKKTNSVTGDKVYTRFYARINSKTSERSSQDESLDFPPVDTLVQSEPMTEDNINSSLRIPPYGRSLSSPISFYSSGLSALENSEVENSSYKSSDNESCSPLPVYKYVTGKAGTLLVCEDDSNENPFRRRRSERKNGDNLFLQKSQSLGNCLGTNFAFLPSERKKLFTFNGRPISTCHSPDFDTASNKSVKSARKISKSASYHKPKCRGFTKALRRANTDSFKNKYIPSGVGGASMVRNMSFLDIYLKSLPSRNKEPPSWLKEITSNVRLRKEAKNRVNEAWRRGIVFSDDQASISLDPDFLYDDDIDSAVENEIRRRLKKYQRVMSCSDYWTWKKDSGRRELKRRYSEGAESTSSESVDEADRVLMRLRRRIFQNKKRERKISKKEQHFSLPKEDTAGLHNAASANYAGSFTQAPCPPEADPGPPLGRRDGVEAAAPPVMGASVGRHGRGGSDRGGGGRRRAQSSGDLCAGPDAGSLRDSCSVAGSVSDAATWNSRSLPSHLDGRRRLPCGGCGRCGDCVSSDSTGYNYTRSFGRPPHRHHRKFSHQYGCKLAADLDPVWKLQDPGCDQGYGSERSPEEEFPPAMPVEEDYEDQEMDLRQMYPFINDENTFTVRVEKDRRGLGLSVAGGADNGGGGGGAAGLVRIRRLYPSQPAWSTGRLRPGDLLLAANGVSLAGLTTYEALEVLRTTPPVVELVVCRPGPEMQGRVSPTGGVPPAPPLRQPPFDPLNLHAPRPRAPAPTPPPLSPQNTHNNNVSDYEEPNPIYDVKYGEFDIVMTKVNGSLGFTLRKEDHSALGHYVRALVREPALSDGRIQPGDRIVAVNDVPMSTLSHGEAVSFLRRCGPVARLRLYRDHCGTPPSPSATSPTTESDTTLITRPKPPLRQEAVNMLCDIAARKLTPDDGNGSRSPCVSPRRYKKLTRNSTGYSQNSDTMHPYSVTCPSTTVDTSDNEMSQTLSYQSTDTADTTYSLVPERRPLRPTCFNGQLFDNSKPPRPDFLDLGGPPTPVNNRKQRLHFSVAAHGYELNNLDNDLLDAPNVYQDMQNGGTGYLSSHPNHQIGSEMSNEPMSMPIELIANSESGERRFSHKNPAYQSAVVHPSTNCHGHNSASDSNKDDGIKKWKCVTLSPDNERKIKIEEKSEPEKPKIVHYPDENREPGTSEPRILTVELNRGWNSRLGFSVQCHPESGQSFISAIYSDSVAAKDGRLRQGDIILQVNDENITSMTTPQVIDLLRILRGSICITVLRQ